MRVLVVAALLVTAGLSVAPIATSQAVDRMNPIIAAQEKGQPITGISHPAITAGRGGRGRRGGAAPQQPAPPPPPIDLAAAAKDTVGYTRADYLYTSGTSETFLRYMEEITKAGGSMRTHPFSAKIGIWHEDADRVRERMVNQLNAGHVSVSMEAVESAQEVRDVIKAMRFVSAGGTRPETGLEHAAAYWGLSVEDYKKKADVWPLNKNGELLLTVIIESREGLAHAREIAAEPGVGQIFAGYGTLGQVFRGDPDGREAAAAQILAACKEFKVPCGFPTNTAAEVEQRMNEGWSVFIMQRRNEDGFAAVEMARKMGGR